MWGTGIMTLMLNDITQRAKDIGTKELYLWTPDPKVVSMYKRQGWNGTYTRVTLSRTVLAGSDAC
jgi:N-acetylglutamate synthase-like GNAT family acetyltransferase